eukprot:TRINITY_DN74247_c0_g1_i1.p1 TRINITY_DN74247_c0_g1~~TRINITY_DN74247_c0_g1_i1.p1  ORF type:complete len:2021 (-),score=338.12 TRINITY_DN74247_c0_g1_i1:54-6116(-)
MRCEDSKGRCCGPCRPAQVFFRSWRTAKPTWLLPLVGLLLVYGGHGHYADGYRDRPGSQYSDPHDRHRKLREVHVEDFNDFCFPESQKGTGDRKSAGPIKLLGNTWLSHRLVTTTAAIFLKEMLRYDVQVVTPPLNDWKHTYGDWIANGTVHVDLENWHARKTVGIGQVQLQDVVKPYVLRNEILAPTTIGYSGRSGLYVLDPIGEEIFLADYYKRYIGDGARKTDGFLGYNVTGLQGVSGAAYPPCSQLLTQWCTPEGYYIPEHCRQGGTSSDPAPNCVEMWMGPAHWDESYFEQLVNNLKINAIFAYHTADGLERRRRELAERPQKVVFYSFTPNWGADEKGSLRISFPDGSVGNSNCLPPSEAFAQGVDGPQACDILEAPVSKVISSRLKSTAPEAHFFLQNFRVLRDALHHMIEQAPRPDVDDQEVRQYACDFLRRDVLNFTYSPDCAVYPDKVSSVFDPFYGECRQKKEMPVPFESGCEYPGGVLPGTQDRRMAGPITVGKKNWLSHELTGTVMAVLLSDYLGYQVMITDMSAWAGADFAIVADKGIADVDPENWYALDFPGEIYAAVEEKQIIEYPKQLGYYGRSGMYVLKGTVDAYPYSDFYKFFQGTHALRSGFVAANLTFYHSAIEDDGPCYNKEDWAYCNSTGYYLPPSCPRIEDCVELLMMKPSWDKGLFEQIVKNNQLSLALGYYGASQAEVVRRRAEAGLHTVFYAFTPDPLLANLGLLKDDLGRISFPDPLEGKDFVLVADDSGSQWWDLAAKPLVKVVRSKLRVEAKQARFMLDRFTFMPDEMAEVMALHSLAGGNMTTKEAVCHFLKTRKDFVSRNAPDCVTKPKTEKDLFIGSFAWDQNEGLCKVLDCPPNARLNFLKTGIQCSVCAEERPSGRVPTEDQKGCIPCPEGQEPNASGVGCVDCQPGGYSNPVLGSPFCMRCPVGTYNPLPGQKECAPCPLGANCSEPGTAVFRADWGFYIFGNENGYSEIVEVYKRRLRTQKNASQSSASFIGLGFMGIGPYECTPKSVCVGDNKCKSYVGETTMEGPLCGTCKTGYTRQTALEPCGRCPDMSENISFLLLGLCLFSVGVFMIDRANAASMGNLREVASVVPKILSNFFMLFSVIARNISLNKLIDTAASSHSLGTALVSPISLALNIGKVLENPTKAFISVECLFRNYRGLKVEYVGVILAWCWIPLFVTAIVTLSAVKISIRRCLFKKKHDEEEVTQAHHHHHHHHHAKSPPTHPHFNHQETFESSDTPQMRSRFSDAMGKLPSLGISSPNLQELQRRMRNATSRHKQEARGVWETAEPLVVVTMYFLHPMVTSLFLSVFKCEPRNEATGLPYDMSRLAMNMSLRCETPEHNLWRAVSALGLLIFGFGIPAAFWAKLVSAQRPGSKHTLHSPMVLRRYGFLYVGFETNCYHQEMIYMMRKVVFLVCETLPWLTVTSRTVLLLFFCCWNMSNQLRNSPYDNRAYFGLDHLESLSSGCLILLLLGRVWELVLQDMNDMGVEADEDNEFAKTSVSLMSRLAYVPALFFLCALVLNAVYLLLRSSIWPADGEPNLPPLIKRFVDERLQLTLTPPSKMLFAKSRAIEHVMLSAELHTRDIQDVADEAMDSKKTQTSNSTSRMLPDSEREMLKTTCTEIIEVLLRRHEVCIGEAPTQINLPTFFTQFERMMVTCLCQAMKTRLKSLKMKADRDTLKKKVEGLKQDMTHYVRSIMYGPEGAERQDLETPQMVSEIIQANKQYFRRPINAEELHVALMQLTPKLLDKKLNQKQFNNIQRKTVTSSQLLMDDICQVEMLFDPEWHEMRFAPLRPEGHSAASRAKQRHSLHKSPSMLSDSQRQELAEMGLDEEDEIIEEDEPDSESDSNSSPVCPEAPENETGTLEVTVHSEAGSRPESRAGSQEDDHEQPKGAGSHEGASGATIASIAKAEELVPELDEDEHPRRNLLVNGNHGVSNGSQSPASPASPAKELQLTKALPSIDGPRVAALPTDAGMDQPHTRIARQGGATLSPRSACTHLSL